MSKMGRGGGGEGLKCCVRPRLLTYYEGWNFNSGKYLFTTDTK